MRRTGFYFHSRLSFESCRWIPDYLRLRRVEAQSDGLRIAPAEVGKYSRGATSALLVQYFESRSGVESGESVLVTVAVPVANLMIYELQDEVLDVDGPHDGPVAFPVLIPSADVVTEPGMRHVQRLRSSL